jgi:transposase-like protein
MTQDIPLTEKQKIWLEHVQACGRSSQSMRAYAEANGLNVSTFYAWKKTLRRKGAFGEPPSAEPPLFHKAVVSDYRIGCTRVRLPSGVTLEFDGSTDPLWVAALVRALP